MKRWIPALVAVAMVGCGGDEKGETGGTGPAAVDPAKDVPKVASGLAPGAVTYAFTVKDVTGPNEGSTLCYRCKYGGRPVVTVFTRGLDEKVQALVDEIDGVVGENGEKEMAAFVVLLSEDEEADAPGLTKLAEEKSIEHTPLTTYAGKDGPADYNIAEKTDVSVMMWVAGEVKVNHAFAAGELTDETIAGVVADTSKILQ